jgi:hypothetical protein
MRHLYNRHRKLNGRHLEHRFGSADLGIHDPKYALVDLQVSIPFRGEINTAFKALSEVFARGRSDLTDDRILILFKNIAA